jgi:transcription initiation factor TFIIIB Brf1 subunit/transcription initiation factor TFIIB
MLVQMTEVLNSNFTDSVANTNTNISINVWEIFDQVHKSVKHEKVQINFGPGMDNKFLEEPEYDIEGLPKKELVCFSCHQADLIPLDGQYVCPNCNLVNDCVIDDTPEWRYYGADDNKSVNPTRCGMPSNDYYPEASLGSNISLCGASSYEMFKVAWYHNCNIMNYKERNFHEYISLMNNYASQADIPGCVIKEAESIYKQITDYRTSIGLHEFRHPTREAVLASCVLEASRMNDCPRSSAEMAEIFHIDRSVFVNGHKEFKKYWDVVQKKNHLSSHNEVKISSPSDYVNRFCSRLNLGPDFKKICHQICDNVKEKNLVPKYVAVSIVAGVIYLVNNLFNLGMKKKQISDICDDVSEATIHKCYLDLNRNLSQIVPKYVLDEVLKQLNLL